MGRWMSHKERLETVLLVLRSVASGRFRKKWDACRAVGINPYSFASMHKTAIKYVEREGIELTEEDRRLLYGDDS